MSVMEPIAVSSQNGAASGRKSADQGQSWLAIGALALIAALQIHFALTRTIHWDEFYFYGQIVDFTQGQTLKPLQTLHVSLLNWIPGLVETGVDGIVIGRMIMLAFAFATAACVGVVASKFARREYAIAAALIWLAAGFTMQHGWSFRTDPLAAGPMMGALAILARARFSTGWIILCGALVGLAGMFTMKTILFLPAFAGLAWLRWSEAKFAVPYALRIVAIPVCAGIAFVALYLLHGANLGDATAQAGASYASGVSQSMLFAGWPVYLNFAVKGAILSISALGAIILTLAVIGQRKRDEVIAVIGLMAPLAALLIYRNTLPYFYPMMLAPVIAASVIGVAAIAERYSLRLLIAYTALSGAVVWAVDGESHMDDQRAIQIASDEIFEEKVGYFDFPDMLPTNIKQNAFLTSWGIEGIYRGGPGYFRNILQQNSVPLLLTNDPELNPTLIAIMQRLPQQARFHEDDRNVLRSTYREFWGPFHLAGSDLSPGSIASYEVLVPGPYTVTGQSIVIDGMVFVEGDVIELDRGVVTLENQGAANAGIIWGDRLKAPERPAPERPYWRGF